MQTTGKTERIVALLGAIFGVGLGLYYYYELAFGPNFSLKISLAIFIINTVCIYIAVASALLKPWAVIIAILVAMLFASSLLFGKPTPGANHLVNLKLFSVIPVAYISVMSYWLYKLDRNREDVA